LENLLNIDTKERAQSSGDLSLDCVKLGTYKKRRRKKGGKGGGEVYLSSIHGVYLKLFLLNAVIGRRVRSLKATTNKL